MTTHSSKEDFNLIDFIMEVEGGEDEMPQEKLVAGVQNMINSGVVVWELQGFWGRLATRLIEAGLCVRPSRAA